MPRHKLEIPFHLLTGAYLRGDELVKYEVTDPILIVQPGAKLTPEQLQRKAEHYKKRALQMVSVRMARRKEAELRNLDAAQKKELIAAVVDECPETLNKVGKKLFALKYDIVTELVTLLRITEIKKNGPMPLKNHERIKVLEILLEFSETRNKAADAAPPEGGFNFTTNIINNFREPEVKPVTEAQVTKVEDGAPSS